MGFNSRARGRARHPDLWQADALMGFNSRARGRARRCFDLNSLGQHSFNSRARGRARPPVGRIAFALSLQFQLTRPWEGATPLERSGISDECFNSRARGRARPFSTLRTFIFVWFQLTRPWEGATIWRSTRRLLIWVSTHAPVGGRDIK